MGRVTATPLPLHAIVELPPETSGALTFHLPLEIFALEEAGAGPEVIQARTAAGLAEAYRSGLVDPPFYRWAVEHHRPAAAALLSASADDRLAAFASVRTLGEGLVGAAFHGLIRTGYGALRRDADEIARGLAYLRTRRQVLQGPGGEVEAAGIGGRRHAPARGHRRQHPCSTSCRWRREPAARRRVDRPPPAPSPRRPPWPTGRPPCCATMPARSYQSTP